MNEKKDDAITTLKSAIIAKAAEALLAELPPERLQQLVETILLQVLSEINTSQYGGVGKIVRERAEETMKTILATEAVQERMREEVRKGIDNALGNISNEIKGKFIDMAVNGLVKEIQAHKRSPY